MARRKVKCTNCGYLFLADPEGMYAAGQVLVVRRAGAQIPSMPASTPGAKTIDLECPNCEKEFEVAVEA